jgi:hypothetical protein
MNWVKVFVLTHSLGSDAQKMSNEKEYGRCPVVSRTILGTAKLTAEIDRID